MNSLIAKSLRLTNTLAAKLNVSNVAAFHAGRKLNSTKYYPINDDIFGLTDDQKEVRVFFLRPFHSAIMENLTIAFIC